MRFHTLQKANKQAGVSLFEILLALGVLGLIAAVIQFTFDGASSKGKAAYIQATQMGIAQNSFAANTSCFARSHAALSKPGLADASGTFCNRDVNARWRGPYLPDSVDENFGEVPTRVIEEVRYSFNRYQGTGDAFYTVEADNLTYLQARAFLLACLERDYRPADFAPDASTAAAALANSLCVVNNDMANNTENNNIKVTYRFAQRRN